MKLKHVTIEGYRSIRQQMKLFVEPNVTVVLGPNDHGKTNLLNALQHLNIDRPFANDADLNWDSSDKAESLPLVIGHFTLSEKETQWLLDAENKAREELNRRIEERKKEREEVDTEDAEDAEDTEDTDETSTQLPVPAKPKPVTAGPLQSKSVKPNVSVPDTDEDEEDDEEDDLPTEPLPLLKAGEVPSEITLQRKGVKRDLTVMELERFQESVQKEFRKFLPRIEFINPITRLSDNVSADELGEGKNEFMRGIFYYAGLEPDESAALFEQTDRTQMKLTRASDRLNTTLRESWSQGKDLLFRLSHHSKETRIELQIEDPSVESTYVRASHRSSGFTHYFSLKTILHARQKDHPAESYILLFDEPGVFLHPSGQFDLLQVLETLSMESQTLYATHSLFMINKTFPTRHRLIMKTPEGTMLDSKPYIGRWHAVLSTLGLTLTGSILFANHVVLTEGDSDPIYIYAVIQKAVSAGKCHLDINSLAVMSTSESKNADVLLRLLHETKPEPHIAVITDGDKGGKERLRYVNAALKEYGIPEKQLPKDTAIEDHVPMIREIYVPAVATYVAKLMVLDGKTKPDEVQLEKDFLSHFDKKFEKGKVTQGVAEWAASAATDIGGVEGKPSKVGIAREYAIRLLELDNREFKLESRTKALIDWIHENASVPELHPAERKILDE